MKNIVQCKVSLSLYQPAAQASEQFRNVSPKSKMTADLVASLETGGVVDVRSRAHGARTQARQKRCHEKGRQEGMANNLRRLEASAVSRFDLGVERVEFHPCVVDLKLPIDAALFFV